MKKTLKVLVAVMSVLMILSCVAEAGLYDDTFNGVSFSELAYYESGVAYAETEMRAFAVDPNGKYMYGGFLQGTPTVYQWAVASPATETASYTFDDSEDPGAYIKAIAADDRGYVYMGVANAANNGAIYFQICSENGLTPVGNWVKIEIEGKVGVNGAAVWHTGDKYYFYFITNYDTDRIYRYDVTDPNNPVLDTSFGNAGGYVDLNATFSMNDADNICVGTDGMIYMAACTAERGGSKGDTIFKIDNKGVGCMCTSELQDEFFGVTTVGAYLATCTYGKGESKVYILNQSDLSLVTEIPVNCQYGVSESYTGMGFANNKLFMGIQGADAVAVSTDIIFPIATDAADDAAAADDTAAETVGDTAKEAPAETTTAPAAANTADAGVVAAAVIMAAAAAVVLSKKH